MCALSKATRLKWMLIHLGEEALLRNLAVGVPIFSALTPFYLSTGIKTNKLSLFP